ncbi:hypothetical protein MmiEs2_13680 [Methanimicrococcus stummii]|uniref:Right handed beta helix domain-containing protein n=1 Tax=Methanimicrococcus stummii TaxID=3028294 RepID=A0AA96ZYR1_9EURY|nr:hypothetical protein [Methanimicrococcus sp. Es2]WNY29151.1 hypothetical protein MmiEs2_13680 [Methanimicrococcus sp. Es2]
MISENIAELGGGIASDSSNVNIYGNASIHKNEAVRPDSYSGIIGGGGLFTRGGNRIKIYENASFTENKHIDKGRNNGGGGAIFSDSVASFEIYDNARIENNSAYQGGGICISATNAITQIRGNVSINGNTADKGGGIFLLNAKIQFSGNDGDVIEISRNYAKDGGGIYTSDIKRITETGNGLLLFKSNSADTGRLWNFTDMPLDTAQDYAVDAYQYMAAVTSTVPFTNPHNNFDIVFGSGLTVYPALIEIEYFKDEKAAYNSLGNESFTFCLYEELNESVIAAALGIGWEDIYIPTDYDSGELIESLPIVPTTDIKLNVLYLETKPPETPPGGSNTTANVTVTETVQPSAPVQPPHVQEEQTGYETPVQGGILVILLFMIAVACYVFVEKRENENDEQ